MRPRGPTEGLICVATIDLPKEEPQVAAKKKTARRRKKVSERKKSVILEAPAKIARRSPIFKASLPLSAHEVIASAAEHIGISRSAWVAMVVQEAGKRLLGAEEFEACLERAGRVDMEARAQSRSVQLSRENVDAGDAARAKRADMAKQARRKGR